MEISAVYRMELIDSVADVIWKKYGTYAKVKQYLELNQTVYSSFGDADFYLQFKDGSQDKIDVLGTLGVIAQNVPEKLVKMAIELGIETPDFIPCIPTFRNKIKDDYPTAAISFEKAFENVETDPAESVGQVNSVLESIMKEILNDKRFSDIDSSSMTRKKLVDTIFKKFDFELDNQELPKEFKAIWNSIMTISKSIEDLRSDKTLFHGQDSEKYLIDDPIYAYLAVNTSAAIGLFLIDFYEKRFPKIVNKQVLDDDLPF